MKRNSYKLFAFSVILSMIFTALPAPRPVLADAPVELFITEYIEGSSFNKAIEIYNGTGSAVDLAAGVYTLELYSNGSATVSQSMPLSGTIAVGDVYVVAHTSADALILAQADATNSTVINFNGDDAIVLRKAGAVIDAFGQLAFDPGTQWSGGGVDDTLRRKATICAGDTNASDTFDASVVWDIFGVNTFDGLGSHTTSCGGVPVVTNPTGTGAADPVSVDPGGSSLLTVVVSPGANPTSTGLLVTCDLGSIGGVASQSFYDDATNGDDTAGDNTFSFLATVDPATSAGDKNLSCTISDAYLRTAPASIDLTINSVGPANIIINEIDSDTPGTDAAEFVELYDGGVGNTSLDGLAIVFYNGSNDLSYASYDLDGYSTDANGYFLLGNSGVSPAPAITFAGNFLQNGADAVALYADDAANFPVNTAVTTINLMDAIVYDTNDANDSGLLGLLNLGQPQVDENGGGNGAVQSNQRCPNGSGGALNTDTYAQFAPTPGDVNTCVIPIAEVKIHEVQGSGAASPIVGQTVAIEGIVVGDFQDGANGTNGDFNGFHIQEEDADADADPLTSEGIFVYDGYPTAVNVQIGDLVRVEGSISEYKGLTEITSFTGVSVLSTGNALPTAAALSLPVTSIDDFEAYEGMLVTFPQPLVISEYFNYDRYGEIVLTSERHLTPSAEFEPGPDAIQAAADFLLDKITLDDGRSTQNPDPAIHPNGGVFDLTNLFRGGDTVANVTGILDYSFGLYRIQPTQGADYTNANPRPAAPEDVGGNLKVASINVLNYFSTLDDGVHDICGPLLNQECRGADDAEEFTRQRTKIIAAISMINADILGLLEIENNVNDDAVIDLVNGLNDVNGAGIYDYVSTGPIGGDAIKVAIIYKPATVSLVGNYAILDSSVDPRFIDTRNRPTLAQSFMDNSTGGIFTIAVNHLKSKGSACAGDPDLGDGAGNCNLTRTAAAEALVDWLATDPTSSGDADFLIMGDLNSYDKEDPIDVILTAGYTDLAYLFQGEAAYSYVFDGQTGYLDYGLANASLLSQVTGMTDWHVNADEPDLIDYDTSFKLPAQDAIYAPDAYRYSDHDPVIIGLDVCDVIAPVFDEVSVSPGILWTPDHKYVDVIATVIVSDNFDPNPTVTLVSVTSNEPDNGYDDGNTINDIVIVDDYTFKLRAERSGVGSGRIYTITYLVTDACGNSTTQSVTVFVPLSMQKR